MILQSLVKYYDALVDRGELPKPGLAAMGISWALEIDENGAVLSVLPLKTKNNNKTVPRQMIMPAPIKKSSGEKSNFLWENAEYLIAMPTQDNFAKTEKRFATAKELHLSLLQNENTPEANAIKNYFNNWNYSKITDSLFSEEFNEDVRKGGYITFFFNGKFIFEYPSLREVWLSAYNNETTGDTMIDLVSGKRVVPEKIHPSIKGVMGAMSAGAALVSFNAKAYESYGHEQNINAPMGKDTAFAYTSALNYLCSGKKHKQQLGDVTLVYWAENAEEAYQSAMDMLLNGANDDAMTDDELYSIMQRLCRGESVSVLEQEIDPKNNFYILGICPSAARLSVKLFYKNSFGNITKNIKQHYDDIEIVPDNRNKFKTIPLWALLGETVNPNSRTKTPLPQLSGDLLKAIITGGRYPETLINQVFIRIRAEKDITRGKAAIIKAYLIRNAKHTQDYNKISEVTTMALNEQSNYTPYVLGRLFSVLEEIQQKANPKINATIKDRYFNSASATPSAIFPILMKLANSHLRKLDTGSRVYLSKKLSELTDKLEMNFPNTLSLKEQGTFILGYYHQTQKRFEGKDKNTNINTTEENKDE